MNMKSNITYPKLLGATHPFLKRLRLSASLTPDEAQLAVDGYVASSGLSVVAGFIPEENTLQLMLWPETRPEYKQQGVDASEQSALELATVFSAVNVEDITPEKGQLHCMMGLKVGGYGDSRVADIKELSVYEGKLAMQPAFMVSARMLHDGTVESYGEPTAILTCNTAAEKYIHEIGDLLEQHHYAIEGHDETRFYETKWAFGQ